MSSLIWVYTVCPHLSVWKLRVITTVSYVNRMCTIMKRQKQSLEYLEQVRQHLSRLPSIDPNTRTLLICGFPNVGKSSFINKVSLFKHTIKIQKIWTPKNWCNNSENWTMWICHGVKCPNNADRMANSVDPDLTGVWSEGTVLSGSALFAHTSLFKNLGSFQYSMTTVKFIL